MLDRLANRRLGIGAAAQYIDMSVHTVYTMVSQRRIPFVKMGRLTKFDVTELDRWIKKNTTMPKTAT